jgi:hypothetical protein
MKLRPSLFAMVALGVMALGAGGWVYRGQLTSLATGRVDTQARIRQVLIASRENPDSADLATRFDGGIHVRNESIRVSIDESSGQLVSISRPGEFFLKNAYSPSAPNALRSEAQAKAAMEAFLRDAGVDMESFELEKFEAFNGPKAAQLAHGHERPVFSAQFAERKSDIRFAGAGSRRGTIVFDSQTGLLLKYGTTVIPQAAPWEVNLTEARAKELATESWREWGASFDSKQMRVKTQYVRSGSSYKVLPEDRLIPAFLLGASTDADSWQCFATIDARNGKVMDSTCHIPNRMRGE